MLDWEENDVEEEDKAQWEDDWDDNNIDDDFQKALR